jgi:hypothetical protein
VSALQGKLFAFNVNPGHRLWRFIDGLEKLFGLGGYFRSTPQLALMAPRALVGIYLYNLQFLLLNKKGSQVQSFRFRVTFNELVISHSGQLSCHSLSKNRSTCYRIVFKTDEDIDSDLI